MKLEGERNVATLLGPSPGLRKAWWCGAIALKDAGRRLRRWGPAAPILDRGCPIPTGGQLGRDEKTAILTEPENGKKVSKLEAITLEGD